MNKILKIFFLSLGVSLPTTVFAAELIYSLAGVQSEALQENMVSGGSAVPIQLVFSSPAQIAAQNEVLIPLPSGGLVAGTVIKTLEGRGPTELEQQADSVTVIAIGDNGGALRMIEQDGTVTGMILVDNKEQKIYQAALDSTGSGVLQEDDRNKYLCVDFPVYQDDSFFSDSLAMLAVAELTPDLSTLQNLESRPGSSKTLYINFWGGVLSGTVWNDEYSSGQDITYTPYSSDVDTDSFSTADRDNVWLAWLETAEDYAPFDINVTTSEAVYLATPAAKRVQLIATTTSDFYPGTAGGVSYNDVFDTSNDYWRTGWVWNSGTDALGMTIAHEAGHQIGGLLHDGISGGVAYYSGHGVWGPIMGAPFGKPYVQWDRGEYSGANNQEDDLGIIKGVLGSVADEAGGANASAIGLSLPVIGYQGQITPDGIFSDVDVYSFSTSAFDSTTSIEVKPLLGDEGENRAANLAMNVTLKNAVGTVISSMSSDDNSPLAPDTNIFTYDGTLFTGTYYLTIEAVSPDTNWSTGFGEYGNGGKYRISINNSSSSAPDLIVVSPSVSNNTLTPNQLFTLYASVENQGTETASLTTLRYYHSTDATISTSDTLIGSDAVLSLAAAEVSAQDVSLSAPSSGTYWLGACVNAVIGESDTSNQCSQGVQITVIQPDLTVVSSVSDSSPTPGQDFTINATVKNQGTATATSSVLRYYRSSDAAISIFDPVLATDFIDALAAGESSVQNASVTAPSTEGTYWIGACVSTVSNESDTANQCSSGVQITVGGQEKSFPWLLFYPAFF